MQVRVDTEISTGGSTVRDGIETRAPRTVTSRLTILDFAYETAPDTPIEIGAMPPDPAGIPTMGEWGLIVLNLLLLIFGVAAVRREKGIKIVKRQEA